MRVDAERLFFVQFPGRGERILSVGEERVAWLLAEGIEDLQEFTLTLLYEGVGSVEEPMVVEVGWSELLDGDPEFQGRWAHRLIPTREIYFEGKGSHEEASVGADKPLGTIYEVEKRAKEVLGVKLETDKLYFVELEGSGKRVFFDEKEVRSFLMENMDEPEEKFEKAVKGEEVDGPWVVELQIPSDLYGDETYRFTKVPFTTYLVSELLRG